MGPKIVLFCSKNVFIFQEIQYNLTYLSRLDSLRTVDSLLVAILTHGSEEVVFGVDGVPVTMSDVFEPFTSERCPALHHKPKFFIINACRGGILAVRMLKTFAKQALRL